MLQVEKVSQVRRLPRTGLSTRKEMSRKTSVKIVPSSEHIVGIDTHTLSKIESLPIFIQSKTLKMNHH